MGTFRVDATIQNVSRRELKADASGLLVDTGSEFSWIPADLLEGLEIDLEKKDQRFRLANGTEITRSVGFAIVRVEGHFTVDEVVFAQPGDLRILGARTLEGLNLTIDPARKRLVAAGPLPAALTFRLGEERIVRWLP